METALYLPVKRFLEKLGFTVKGEVGGCDLVALSGDDPPVVVIGELKLTFNLELILQAVDRAGACDEVWLAAKLSARGKGRESDARYRNLCRRLGFGMLAVTNTGDVEVIVKPATTAPRRNPKKRSRLVSEHQRRKGDPAMGGSTRAPIMTAYRQQALACASALCGRPAAGEGSARRYSGRRQDSAAQCLWLVRPRRARHLCADRCRTRRAETLAAAAAGACRRRIAEGTQRQDDKTGDQMIVVTGSVTARQDSFDEVRRLSLEHVHRSRGEPGCISHAVHVDCENPLRLVFFEQWADRAALLRHFAVPASRDFVKSLQALAAAATTIELYDATRLETL